jgi:integrase
MLAGRGVVLSLDLRRHADLQRALGFRFRTQYALLRLFVSYAEGKSDEFILAKRVIDWASLAPSANQRRNRLLMVRRFALALRAEDQRHEVPPAQAFGTADPRRRRPYIYTPDEIASLMAATARLGAEASLKVSTYRTLFGLLAATGMRVSEALALRIADVTADGLLIRTTKFQKSRLLPLHDTVRNALDRHLRQLAPGRQPDGESIFTTANHRALPYDTAAGVFRRLAGSVGLRGAAGKPDARLHDLRHTFAVRSLENCPPERHAIARHLVALSTYLGHARAADTYWYLEATPLLLREVADAGESLLLGEWT